jgi:DNA repair protein RecO (recombination protein O)
MSTRPRVYRAEGIVLRRRNIGEADSIFTVLASDGRKFEAVARGARKTRSRMRGHLEPLTHSRFLIATGKSLDVFTQAETIESFRHLRDYLERSSAGMYCAELCDRFTVEDQENRQLFHLLRATLTALDAGAVPDVVLRYFELQILAISGFELQLAGCARCGARLNEEPALFSAGGGGLFCRNCRPEAGAGRLMSVRAIKTLRFGRGAKLARFCEVQIEPALLREMQSALEEAIVFHLDRRLGTRRFLEDVAELPDPPAETAETR